MASLMAAFRNAVGGAGHSHSSSAVPTAIKTPNAMEDVRHSTSTGTAHTAPPAASDHSAPSGAAAADRSEPASIPRPQYGLPPPTWRVKPQFSTWEIDHTRFEVKRILGKGSYGSVAEAYDHVTKQRVAIKRIPGVFEVFENAKRIYREVRILRMMAHPNVIQLVHLEQPSDLLNWTDLYVVFACMDTDLAKLTRDETQCLTVPHVRWFLYQLLLGMKYIHSAKILHRDIKPANILLTEACDLKICDFGLARTLEAEADDGTADDAHTRDMLGVSNPKGAEAEMVAAEAAAHDSAAASGSGGGDGSGLARPDSVHRQFTRHVVTRWYRAPELPLYNDGEYTTAIDVWSVGCVYAEMLGMLDTGDPESRYDRHALFPGGACYPMSRDRGRDKSGKEKKEQLAVIFDVLGTPTDEEIARVRTPAASEYLRSLKKKAPEDLNKRYPTAGPQAIDLLHRFLRFHAEDRITIDEALAHPFLAPVRRPHDELGRREGAIHFGQINADNIRQLLVEEIRAFNANIPADWERIAAQQAYAAWASAAASPATPDPSAASGAAAAASADGDYHMQ